jgi:hypothetical protein
VWTVLAFVAIFLGMGHQLRMGDVFRVTGLEGYQLEILPLRDDYTATIHEVIAGHVLDCTQGGQPLDESLASLRRIVGEPLVDVLRSLIPDADVGRRFRNANPGGRPMKDRPSDEALWDEMRREIEIASVRRTMSATEAAKIVAKRHGLHPRHVLRVTKLFRAG